MIKIQIIGNVGVDAQIKQVGTNQVLEFTVAHNEKWTTDQGPQERTVWVKVARWYKGGDPVGVAQYLKKGQKVYCEGQPEVRAWIDKNPDAESLPLARAELSMKCINIELLGGGAGDTGGTPTPPQPTTPPPPPKQVWNDKTGKWEQVAGETATGNSSSGFNAAADLPF